MQPTTRHVLASLLWIGLMLPTCAVADPPASQATAPQATGPQAMFQQSLMPPATAAEAIPAGQPAGPAVAHPPAWAAGPDGAEDDGSSWYAGTFGPNCAPAPCCEICGGGSGPPPDYYIEGGPSVLTRGKPNGPIVNYLRNSGDPGTVPATAALVPGNDFHAIDQGISGGMLGTIGHYIGRDANDRDEFIEFSYWGLSRWQGTVTSDSNDYIFYETNSSGQLVPVLISHNLYSDFPFTIGGFNRADTQTLSEKSSLNNFEVNYRFGPRNVPDQLVLHPNGRWRRECVPGWYCSYLFGLRFLDIHDAAVFFSEATYDVNNVPTPATGFYSIYTRNRLLGCQVGADFTYRHCLWNVNLHGRAGPYLDFIGSDSTIMTHAFGINPYATQDLNTQNSLNHGKAAVVAEFGVAASYKFRPNLVGRVSYDFVWIGGLALAPEQFDYQTVPVPHVNNSGVLLVNGVTLGLEYTW